MLTPFEKQFILTELANGHVPADLLRKDIHFARSIQNIVKQEVVKDVKVQIMRTLEDIAKDANRIARKNEDDRPAVALRALELEAKLAESVERKVNDLSSTGFNVTLNLSPRKGQLPPVQTIETPYLIESKTEEPAG